MPNIIVIGLCTDLHFFMALTANESQNILFSISGSVSPAPSNASFFELNVCIDFLSTYFPTKPLITATNIAAAASQARTALKCIPP